MNHFQHHATGILSSSIWAVRHGLPLINQLRENGLTQLRPFRPWSWSRVARYFLAMRGTQAVFIKVVSDSSLGQREIDVNQFISKHQDNESPWFPQLLIHGRNQHDHFMVFEAIRGQTLSRSQPPSGATLERQLQQLALFHDRLMQLQLVHRDIRPANVLVPQDGGSLILIDFGFAVGTGSVASQFPELSGACADRAHLRRLGHGFNPAAGVWDDAYSLCQTMKFIHKNCVALEPFQRIADRVGHCRVELPEQ